MAELFRIETKAPDRADRSTQARTALLVLGMHRSGTSALTRVLSMAGAALPDKLLRANSTNPKGHWEPVALNRYFDGLFAELDSAWTDWRDIELDRIPAGRRTELADDLGRILQEEFPDGDLVAIKDPRMCRFVPLVESVLRARGVDTRAIVMIRNPLEVADSLQRRSGLRRADAGLLWLRHVLDAERATRAMPRVIVSFDALLADWRTELERFAASFAIDWPNPLDEIAPEVEHYLDDALRHHAYSAKDVGLDPDFRGWIADAFSAMSVVGDAPASAAAQAALDRIADELRHATPLMSRLSEDYAKPPSTEEWSGDTIAPTDLVNMQRRVKALAADVDIRFAQADTHRAKLDDGLTKALHKVEAHEAALVRLTAALAVEAERSRAAVAVEGERNIARVRRLQKRLKTHRRLILALRKPQGLQRWLDLPMIWGRRGPPSAKK